MANSYLDDFLQQMQVGNQGVQQAAQEAQQLKQQTAGDLLRQQLTQTQGPMTPEQMNQLSGLAYQAGDKSALDNLMKTRMAQLMPKQPPQSFGEVKTQLKQLNLGDDVIKNIVQDEKGNPRPFDEQQKLRAEQIAIANNLSKQGLVDTRKEMTAQSASKMYNSEMDPIENAIGAANRVIHLINASQKGDFKITKGVRATLDMDLAALSMAGKSTLGGMYEAQTKTLGQDVKDLIVKLTDNPQDTVAKEMLLNKLAEANALRDAWADAHMAKWEKLKQMPGIEGYSDQLGKAFAKSREKLLSTGEETKRSYSADDLIAAANSIGDTKSAEMFKSGSFNKDKAKAYLDYVEKKKKFLSTQKLQGNTSIATPAQ